MCIRDRYWKVLKIIEEACKYWRIHHQPTFWMDRYNYDIFNRDFNVQGIHGFWEDTTVPVKGEFMRNFFQMQRDVRNQDYQGPFEFVNEPIHGGNHEYGGQIADHHLALWREIENMTVIGNGMTCSRGSEFAHANFVGEHWFESLNRTFGSEEFESRDIKPEYHGVSTRQALIDDIWSGVGSGWRWLAYNEDGSNPEDGEYNPIPWTPFRLASAPQFYDTMYFGHTTAEDYGKTYIQTAFMMDCLRQDQNDKDNQGRPIAKEEFDPEQLEHMNFERPDMYRAMREDTA